MFSVHWTGGAVRWTWGNAAVRRRLGRRQRPLAFVEQLEDRCLLSAVGQAAGLPVDWAGGIEAGEVHVQPLIVAGDPNGDPPDSPEARVDPNTITSPFAGVGSLWLKRGPFVYICSATAISPQHVLTAGHCLDTNNNGGVNFKPEDVSFVLNSEGDGTQWIPAAALDIHPSYNGFNSTINYDVAVITLSRDLPDNVPIYPLYTGELLGQEITMVGYGQSGDGVSGFYVGANFNVKRVGYNVVDAVWPGSPDAATNDMFLFDFDGPTGDGPLGGPTLGNDREATLGGGDSGGPSFIEVDGQLHVAGVNTFGINMDAPFPFFGSGAGGMIVSAYAGWIDDIVSADPGGGDDGGDNGDGGGKGNGKGGGNGGGRKIGEPDGGFDAPTVPRFLPPAGNFTATADFPGQPSAALDWTLVAHQPAFLNSFGQRDFDHLRPAAHGRLWDLEIGSPLPADGDEQAEDEQTLDAAFIGLATTGL